MPCGCQRSQRGSLTTHKCHMMLKSVKRLLSAAPRILALLSHLVSRTIARTKRVVKPARTYHPPPVNPGGGLAGSVRLARSQAARLAAALRRKPTLGKWRHSAWLPSGLVLGSPTSIEHACLCLPCGWLRVALVESVLRPGG